MLQSINGFNKDPVTLESRFNQIMCTDMLEGKTNKISVTLHFKNIVQQVVTFIEKFFFFGKNWLKKSI